MMSLLSIIRKTTNLSTILSSSRRAFHGNQPSVSEILSTKDDNDRALEELDVGLLKPFPEFRNNAAGPIIPIDFYEKVWKPWKAVTTVEKIKEPDDDAWKEYMINNDFAPDEYFTKSEFVERYHQNLVWADYRRCHKGGIQPQRTRGSCIRNGVVRKGSPCPICRDQLLLITYNNIPLLKHFIDPNTATIYSSLRTGVCKRQQKRLIQAYKLAKELGYLPNHIVGREVNNYDDFQKKFTFAI